jgi:hypothetical protein
MSLKSLNLFNIPLLGTLRERVAPTKPKVTRGEVLAARPLRNSLIEWERVEKAVESGYRDEDGDDSTNPAESVPVIVLTIPRRNDRSGNMVAKWLKLPETRKVELDEMGSDVWEKCDGKTPVEVISREICQKYRLNKRQGEVSVTAYLKMLADRRFIYLKNGTAKNGIESGIKSPDKPQKKLQNLPKKKRK